LRLSHFSDTNLHGLIDRLAAEVREAQPREYQKWGFEPRGGSYQSEIKLMKRVALGPSGICRSSTGATTAHVPGAQSRWESGIRFMLTVPNRSDQHTRFITRWTEPTAAGPGRGVSACLIFTEPVALDVDTTVDRPDARFAEETNWRSAHIHAVVAGGVDEIPGITALRRIVSGLRGVSGPFGAVGVFPTHIKIFLSIFAPVGHTQINAPAADDR
jgi:hypothetical protein